MEREQRDSISEILSHHLPEGADVVAIAGVLARDFQAIQRILTPILGPRGVAALYHRSLHKARADHPWLAGPLENASPTLDLVALVTAIERQPHRADAVAAATALLRAFHDLLASLIGQPLTERLLDPVWAPPGPPPAQDIPT